jgi:hypothetical protein
VFASDYAIRLYGLPAGYYVMEAMQQGHSVRNGGLRAGNGDLQITLGIDGPSVSGQVLAEDGTAIPDASVLLAASEPGRAWAALADQNGVYRFPSGLPPGKYRIAAVENLLESQRLDNTVVARLAASGIELTLGPHESRVVDPKLSVAR